MPDTHTSGDHGLVRAPRRILHLALLAATLLAPLGAASTADARSIYLNGVRIDGVTDQVFENCTVRIDGTGSVHIEAKGYKVQKVDADIATGGPGGEPVQETYWLVVDETAPGRVQWDLDVLVNGRLARKIPWQAAAAQVDVTRFLYQGSNRIHFRARRNLTQPRISYSPDDRIRLRVAAGRKEGNRLVLTRVLTEFTLSAAQTDSVDEDRQIQAR